MTKKYCLSLDYANVVIECFLPEERICVNCGEEFREESHIFRNRCKNCGGSSPCSACKKIDLISMTNVDDLLFCSVCYKKFFRICKHCSTVFPKNESKDEELCPTCEKTVSICHICRKFVEKSCVKAEYINPYTEESVEHVCLKCIEDLIKRIPQNLKLKDNVEIIMQRLIFKNRKKNMGREKCAE